MNEKLYSQHDLDTAQRITSVEAKIDGLSSKLDERCDDIQDSLKSIRAHQNKEYSIKDAFSFAKKNYKTVGILLILIIGGDTARQKLFDVFTSGLSSSHTQAQDKDKE